MMLLATPAAQAVWRPSGTVLRVTAAPAVQVAAAAMAATAVVAGLVRASSGRKTIG